MKIIHYLENIVVTTEDERICTFFHSARIDNKQVSFQISIHPQTLGVHILITRNYQVVNYHRLCLEIYSLFGFPRCHF